MAIKIQTLRQKKAVLQVRVTGTLTRGDYRDLCPVIDELVEEYGKIRILFQMHEFHGWTAGALWQDVQIGIKHFGDIERMALIGEKPWQKGLALFCRPFTRARIHYFQPEELDAAWEWLLEGSGARANDDTSPTSGSSMHVAELLRTLGGDNGMARQDARRELVEMGSEVTGDLIRAAEVGSWQLRLEATQALAAIGDPALAEPLAGHFMDSFEIGWAAAEGLARLGKKGAKATLHQLLAHPNSHGVRVSACHALRNMQDLNVRSAVAPVVAALNDSAPAAEAPVAALAVLEQLHG